MDTQTMTPQPIKKTQIEQSFNEHTDTLSLCSGLSMLYACVCESIDRMDKEKCLNCLISLKWYI